MDIFAYSLSNIFIIPGGYEVIATQGKALQSFGDYARRYEGAVAMKNAIEKANSNACGNYLLEKKQFLKYTIIGKNNTPVQKSVLFKGLFAQLYSRILTFYSR